MSTSEEQALLREQAQTTSVPRDPLIGTVFAGKYDIERLLGTGGMSSVYAAKNRMMKTHVALKVLQSHLAENPTSILRFKQEAVAINQLKHKNIVGYQDFDTTPGPESRPYIAMELLTGHSLSEVIERDGALSPERVLKIFTQACDALAHAHSRGVIHRDLKPSNLMLVREDGEEDVVKIVDFGIAKMMPHEGEERQNLTQTGEIFGSPLYMSPEQCTGQRLDARSDIYSMGCILYEALSAVAPFRGNNVYETINKHISELPTPLASSLPKVAHIKKLDDVILRAMAKDPTHRYQSMLEMKADLESVIQGSRKSLPTVVADKWRTSVIKAVPFLKRLSPKALMSLTVAAAIMTGCATWVVQTRSSNPALPPHDWGNYPGPAVIQSSEVFRETEIQIKQLLNVIRIRHMNHDEELKVRSRAAAWFLSHGLYNDALAEYSRITRYLGDAMSRLALPNQGDIAYHAADCFYESHDYQEAIRWYEAASDRWKVTTSFNGSDAIFSMCHIKLADSYARCDRTADALREMEEGKARLHQVLRQLGPTNAAMYYSKRGDLQYRLKYYSQAIESYRDAVLNWQTVNKPDEAAYAEFNEGLAQEQLKHYSQAESLYDIAAKKFKELKRPKDYAVILLAKSRVQAAQFNFIGAALSDIEAHSVWSSN